MNIVDSNEIKKHAAVRFRSEYHYAVFEYWRSAKLLQWLASAGVNQLGRVLDDGCGGGGMCVSLAEETDRVTGIDLDARFGDAGTRLSREKNVSNLAFSQADGTALPFGQASFDLVISHSVIEHVAEPAEYLREAKRTLRPGGLMFLQTAPYLSPPGSHLPQLKFPLPLHLMFGRNAAFNMSRWIAKYRGEWLQNGPDGSSFSVAARQGEVKNDDLLYLVTVSNLRTLIASAGFHVAREHFHVSGLAKRCLPHRLASDIPKIPIARDILVTNIEYLLVA